MRKKWARILEALQTFPKWRWLTLQPRQVKHQAIDGFQEEQQDHEIPDLFSRGGKPSG